MEVILFLLIIGAFVLYTPVRRLIFQSIWAIIVGASVVGLTAIALGLLIGLL
jgi:hypothetical protein